MPAVFILIIIVGVLFIWGVLVYHGVITKKQKPHPFDYPIDPEIMKRAKEKVKGDRLLGKYYTTETNYYKELWRKQHNNK